MKNYSVKAFPSERLFQQGMDLRDYFAAKAMPCLTIVDLFYSENPSQIIENVVKKPDDVEDEIRAWLITHTVQDLVKLRCKYAYLVADAMMEARNK